MDALTEPRFRDASRTTTRERAALGVFGKHPAWPEHIRGFAGDERLLAVKRAIYDTAIRGNIDNGAWTPIPGEPPPAPFDHAFAWRTADDLVLGLLWDSTDHLGRSEYPMMACAACGDAPPEWALAHVLPLLDQLRWQCARTGAACPPLPAGGTEHARSAAEAATRDAIEAARRTLERLVDAAGFPPTPPNPAPAVHDPQGHRRHLRIPAPADGGCAHWLPLLGSAAPAHPVLVIQPIQGSWAEAIVGEPDAADLYVLRRPPLARPTNDPPTTAPPPLPLPPPPRPLVPYMTMVGLPTARPTRSRTFLCAAALCLVLALLLLLLLFSPQIAAWATAGQ